MRVDIWICNSKFRTENNSKSRTEERRIKKLSVFEKQVNPPKIPMILHLRADRLPASRKLEIRISETLGSRTSRSK